MHEIINEWCLNICLNNFKYEHVFNWIVLTRLNVIWFACKIKCSLHGKWFMEKLKLMNFEHFITSIDTCLKYQVNKCVNVKFELKKEFLIVNLINSDMFGISFHWLCRWWHHNSHCSFLYLGTWIRRDKNSWDTPYCLNNRVWDGTA